ncbi:hypothetical protein B0H11DRAFT_2195641 [Mycena galericulata]|nr:hypothetical protein B0H11DRAFT_2195641 [Mycena galericulata]
MNSVSPPSQNLGHPARALPLRLAHFPSSACYLAPPFDFRLGESNIGESITACEGDEGGGEGKRVIHADARNGRRLCTPSSLRRARLGHGAPWGGRRKGMCVRSATSGWDFVAPLRERRARGRDHAPEGGKPRQTGAYTAEREPLPSPPALSVWYFACASQTFVGCAGCTPPVELESRNVVDSVAGRWVCPGQIAAQQDTCLKPGQDLDRVGGMAVEASSEKGLRHGNGTYSWVWGGEPSARPLGRLRRLRELGGKATGRARRRRESLRTSTGRTSSSERKNAGSEHVEEEKEGRAKVRNPTLPPRTNGKQKKKRKRKRDAEGGQRKTREMRPLVPRVEVISE